MGDGTSPSGEQWRRRAVGCTTVHTIPCPLPTMTAHLAWTGVEEPGSAPRLHKSCIGSIKVGKHCYRTSLQWCHPCRDHPGGWWPSGATSKTSSTVVSNQLFLIREGHPLPEAQIQHSIRKLSSCYQD